MTSIWMGLAHVKAPLPAPLVMSCSHRSVSTFHQGYFDLMSPGGFCQDWWWGDRRRAGHVGPCLWSHWRVSPWMPGAVTVLGLIFSPRCAWLKLLTGWLWKCRRVSMTRDESKHPLEIMFNVELLPFRAKYIGCRKRPHTVTEADEAKPAQCQNTGKKWQGPGCLVQPWMNVLIR